MMKVQLLPGNALAWEVYHQAVLPGVGPLIRELLTLELTQFEADELATKLEVMALEYMAIDADELERRQQQAKARR